MFSLKRIGIVFLHTKPFPKIYIMRFPDSNLERRIVENFQFDVYPQINLQSAIGRYKSLNRFSEQKGFRADKIEL